jgi:hypothetical protein
MAIGDVVIDCVDTKDPRSAFYMANYDAMVRLATRAHETGRTHDTHVVVAIDADDSTWIELRDALMPGHDWDAYRQRGEHPVARGIVPKDFFTPWLYDAVPALRGSLDRVPVLTHIALVFANGGAMARDIV